MNKKLLLIAGVAVTSASIYSSTLIAATVPGDAAANVITPLGITQAAAGMNFGDVAGDTGGTSVVLTTAGTTSGSGVVPGGTTAAGAFDVTGEVSTAYTLTLPASTTIDDGANSMVVNAFTTTLTAAGPNTFTGTLDGLGDDNFTVGATLTIGATQAAGTYSGTYAVIVSYD